MGSTIQVLLIEDNGGDARLVREYLDPPSMSVRFGAPRPGWASDTESPSGYKVHHVESLGEALAALLKNRFDVMLLDLELPDSARKETAAALREFGAGLPIVILSGMDDLIAAEEAIEYGFQDYLVKREVGEKSLRRAIRHALVRHRSRQSVQEDALRDEVTGLYNLRGLKLAGARHLATAEQGEQPCMVLVIRIADFPRLDIDVRGRAMLAWVGGVLQATFSADDALARIGQDAFVVCSLPCDGQRASELVTELEQRLSTWSADPSWPGRVTVSVGAAPYQSAETIEELLDAAAASAEPRQRPRRSRIADPRGAAVYRNAVQNVGEA